LRPARQWSPECFFLVGFPLLVENVALAVTAHNLHDFDMAALHLSCFRKLRKDPFSLTLDPTAVTTCNAGFVLSKAGSKIHEDFA
jgi:hypothetical protein